MTFNEKIKIFMDVDLGHKKHLQEYKIQALTFSIILKNKQQIIENVTSEKGKSTASRNNINIDTDDKLFEWFTDMRAKISNDSLFNKLYCVMQRI